MEAARKLLRALTRAGIAARLHENVGVIELIDNEPNRKFVDLYGFADYGEFNIVRIREHFNQLIITFNYSHVIFRIRQSDFSSIFDELFTIINDNTDTDYSEGYTVPAGTMFTSITDNDERIVKFYDHEFNENVAARTPLKLSEIYKVLPRDVIEKIGNVCIIGNYFVGGMDLGYSADGGSYWLVAQGQKWQYIEEIHSGDRSLKNEQTRIPVKELSDIIVMPNQTNGLYNNCVVEDDKKYDCIYEYEGMYFAWNNVSKIYVHLKSQRLGGRTKAAIRDI